MYNYIGIDLGGTNIKAGLVDEAGNILKRASRPTLREREYSKILNDIEAIAREVSEGADGEIKGLGIGVPGACNNRDGVIVYTANIKMKNVPVREFFRERLSYPVYVENDANCAALGEYSMLPEKPRDLIFITLGTGIGSGLILDGRLYTGFNGIAGEAGHIIIMPDGIKCGCGRQGCWEAYGSVTALIRQTKEYAMAHPESKLREACGKDFELLSGRTAFTLARQGDMGGKAVVDKWISYVAAGITDMVNLLQPSVVLIGGAISNEGDFLLKPVIENVERDRYKSDVPQTEIKIARWGNDAGLIGAAFLGK